METQAPSEPAKNPTSCRRKRRLEEGGFDKGERSLACLFVPLCALKLTILKLFKLITSASIFAVLLNLFHTCQL